MVVLRLLFATALVVRRRYFIAAPRPVPAAPFVVRRRCLIVMPRPMPAAHASSPPPRARHPSSQQTPPIWIPVVGAWWP
jgi:hypothetical protein